ncbi:hypothetical protein [Yinghuangia soli]|uniref:Uncharacterized protein n=1 Tax=Yinghuangia soli TaxID=2908204 RepID=A0AA41U493_9ACTN|nr:hypothetical protein [Yinghuangia soli]MCF2533533.1 hypothetical protein [Yinghuangia soli]
MYEPKKPHRDDDRTITVRAEQVVAWLAAQDDVERTLWAALGGLPREHDETVARMAEVLQATAHGLGLEAAAMWSRVPAHVVRNWQDTDPAFAAALQAAAAFAAAHRLGPGSPVTPAKVRVAITALGRGASWPVAAKVAGISDWRRRQLSRSSAHLAALATAARQARPTRAKRPDARPADAPNSDRPTATGFRLVRRADADADADAEAGHGDARQEERGRSRPSRRT